MINNNSNIKSNILKKFGFGTKDGKISETKQGSTGDCWLMSRVNALSYTDKGKEIINNALEYNANSTTVHLRGFGDITITNEELQEAKNSGKFSNGDDDMLALELAMQKFIKEVKSGNIKLDPNMPDEIKNAIETTLESSDNVSGGFPVLMMYLLTGKVGASQGSMTQGGEGVKNLLEQFEKNGGKDVAMCASFGENTNVQDINGNTVTLIGPHAYSIKEVKDGICTLINPWDSSQEIKVSIDTLDSVGCRIDYNKTQNFFS